MAGIKTEGIGPNIDKSIKRFTAGDGLYFYSELSDEIIIKELIPESLSYSYSPQFAGQTTLGRISPLQIFSGGSAKTYSFSLKLHEDALVSTNFDKITDIVDALKSLSYPIANSDGTLNFPRVYFSLGSITGYGIVKTSISLNKPIRAGRYIMAEVSFTITSEEILPQTKLTTKEVETTVDGEVIYTNKIFVSSEYYSLDGLYNVRDVFSRFTDLDTSISSFIAESSTVSKIDQEDLLQYIDFAADRITQSYDTFAGANFVENNKLNNLKDSISALNEINEFDLDPGKDTDSVPTILDNLERDFMEYLDYYYEYVDRDMTKEQYEQIEGNLYAILDKIKENYRRVKGYGKSN